LRPTLTASGPAGGAPSKSNARTAARSTKSPFAKPTSVARCNTLGRTSDKKAAFQSHFGAANENGRALLIMGHCATAKRADQATSKEPRLIFDWNHGARPNYSVTSQLREIKHPLAPGTWEALVSWPIPGPFPWNQTALAMLTWWRFWATLGKPGGVRARGASPL
jgi:hypothetical protein